MDCSMPCFLVHHQLPQIAQILVHWVSDIIQLSQPLSSPSPTFNFSQHQGLFQRVSSLHQMAKLLELQLPLGLTGLISLQSKGLLRVFSNTTVQKRQFSAFCIVQLSHPYMTTGKTIALTIWTFVGKIMSLLFNMLSIGYTFSSKEQVSFNFMAAVTICSDFWSPRKLSLLLFPLFPHLFAMK